MYRPTQVKIWFISNLFIYVLNCRQHKKPWYVSVQKPISQSEKYIFLIYEVKSGPDMSKEVPFLSSGYDPARNRAHDPSRNCKTFKH